MPNWVYVVMLAGLFAWFQMGAPRPRGPLDGERVFLCGDSLAQGLTGPMKALAASDGVAFGADSQVGSTFPAWSSRAVKGAVGMNATTVFISLGTNDAAANPEHQAKVAGWARQLTAALLSELPDARVFFIAPPAPMPFSLDTVMAALRQSGVPVLVEQADLPRYDRIHPTPAAFKVWAEDIWKAIMLWPPPAPAPNDTTRQPPLPAPSPQAAPRRWPSLRGRTLLPRLLPHRRRPRPPFRPPRTATLPQPVRARNLPSSPPTSSSGESVTRPVAPACTSRSSPGRPGGRSSSTSASASSAATRPATPWPSS